MAKTRLNKGKRHALTIYAKSMIKASPETIAEARKLYKEAEKLVRAGLREKFPTRDMKVLRKFKCTTIDECLLLASEDGAVYVFDLPHDKGFEMPSRSSCLSREAHALGADVHAAVMASNEAQRKLSKEEHQILQDYRAVIAGCNTVEDVYDIWPGAKAIDDKLRSANTSLVAINDDVIARIQAREQKAT